MIIFSLSKTITGLFYKGQSIPYICSKTDLIEDVDDVVRPEGERVRLVLPLTIGTVSLRGVVVPLDLPEVTDLLGIRLSVPSSVKK